MMVDLIKLSATIMKSDQYLVGMYKKQRVLFFIFIFLFPQRH